MATPPRINRNAFRSGLWFDAPLVDVQFDPTVAVVWDFNATTYDAASVTGDWTLTQATAGAAAVSTAQPGTLLIDAGSTTDNQGVNLQNLKAAFVPAANKDIWAEFYVTLTATTPPVTRAQLFVGLAAPDTTIIAGGVQTANNRIGWQILDGALLVSSFTCDKAGTGTTAAGHTFVAATAVRLGFKYISASDTVQQYVNGVATGSAVATANIPKVAIYPSFVCQSDATDRPNLLVHAARVVQLR